MTVFKKSVQYVSLSVAMVVLAACSETTGTQAPVDNMNASDSGPGVKVSGAGDNAGFGDSDNKFGGATSGLQGGTLKVGEQTYYFDFDKSTIHDADRPSIQVQSNYLIKNQSAKVLLEGHTDPRGSREYNVALGERRANAVLAVMKADGADAEQTRTVSYGAEKLASPGHTDADYALDRRVHLNYVEK